jgi:hypothetical protein
MRNKDQFFYEVYCSNYGKAFFSSLKKAIDFKNYLVENYGYKLQEQFLNTGAFKFNAEYVGNATIYVKKQILNIH